MEVRFIEKRTLFDIALLSEIPGFDIKFKANFYDVTHNSILHMEGKDLYEFCEGKRPGIRFTLVFYRGSKEYSFVGKYERVLTKNGINLTEISMLTNIEEKNRRSMPRLEVEIPVSLYLLTDKNEKELICKGQTVDISFEAICLLSNDAIDVPDNSKIYVDFVLFRYDRFYLPAKLVRKGNAPQSVQYKYDYALIFDFSNNPADKNRMLTCFFQSRLESQRS